MSVPKFDRKSRSFLRSNLFHTGLRTTSQTGMAVKTKQVARAARDITKDPRWMAVLSRDPAADGQFVYAVKTTGIYCKPSSATRLPKPENVEFFATAQAAEAAGYRSSTAMDQTKIATERAKLVAEACRKIDAAETAPSLAALAQFAFASAAFGSASLSGGCVDAIHGR